MERFVQASPVSFEADVRPPFLFEQEMNDANR
jgi:hypothetical protein